jgi:2-methylcitrate dehydratase PrpD
MAERGYTSSERAIEAKRGFAQVMSTRFDSTVITSGLGERYEIMQNMYKPFACGLVVHAVIDGCLQLRRDFNLKAADIKKISATVSPLVMELTAKREPRTGLESKFSVYHALAVAIVRGAAGEAEFSAEAALDPQVVALRSRVEVTENASIRKLEGRVVIEMNDGRVLERHVPHALGTLEHPMSDADLEAKFRGLATGVLSDARLDALVTACWGMANLKDAGEVSRLAGNQ